MQRALLGLAASLAAIAIPAPAQAQDGSRSAFTALSGASSFNPDFRNDGDRRRDRDRRRHRGGDRYVFFGDREYQGDTTWRHDSFNDWWHERPHRSYPAWVSRNQNCERLWWSGGGWRC